MAHIKSIGVGMFSQLAYNATASTGSPDTQADFEALTFIDVANVRECPPIGAPANIVNVPQYGQSISASVQGQADAPTLEFVLNWVPDHGVTAAAGVPVPHNTLQGLVNNGIDYDFRVRILNAPEPAGGVVAATEYEDFYFTGKLAAFVVSAPLDDSGQATMTVALNSEFFGPYTEV